jgi:hypothetical protein
MVLTESSWTLRADGVTPLGSRQGAGQINTDDSVNGGPKPTYEEPLLMLKGISMGNGNRERSGRQQ